jgi:hypothetical protein
MPNFGKKIKDFTTSVFGIGETQRRMAKSAVKMIIGDMVTLHDEFKKYRGTGALFFTPHDPLNSSYVTLQELVNDKSVAEEMCDENIARFLDTLIKLLQKHEGKSQPIVVLCNDVGFSVHVLDLNEADERIDKVADAAS